MDLMVIFLSSLSISFYSKIYCDSELLHDVELAHIYPDSKTFVDKRMKFSEPYILSKYEELKAKNEGKPPSKEELVDFVSEHFEDGDELEKWDPPDFKPETTLMAKVSDEGMIIRKFLNSSALFFSLFFPFCWIRLPIEISS